MKRGADKQITKDDGEEVEGEASTGGVWKEASAAKIAERKIVKVRRKDPGATSATPAINLGGAAAPAAGGFNFDFSAKKEEASKPPVVNAFAALVNKENWECPSCLVSNKKEATQCASCEEPRAGAAKAAAPVAGSGAPTFSFGAPAAGAPKFTFGAPAAGASSGASAAPAFSFGTGTTGVTFGSMAATGQKVTFGLPAAGTASPFSSSTTTFGASKEETGTRKEFADKKAESSGTEQDTTLFKISCKVFTLQTVTAEPKEGEEASAKKGAPKFVECGEGDLNVNTVNKEDGTKAARLVLRADKTQRLVLNCRIFQGMNINLQGEKFVKFASSTAEGKPQVYLLKLKNKQESTQVMEHMEKAIQALS